ncbi:DUF6884 domain-containing protein [Halalkalibacterium halodurans]|uniref:DUF6884 domain-containing protein n=1 Tax=Halalkalibacterium halodurans TaxID=86665 RepID=UPI002AA9A131|nr:DUF6884 domain-containing protein [Halalkalibacterium halodurans]MDY7221550.1 hypothetical protein [Halalkalibacterium halodurans]MDY7240826.1 hypothetical protein [Halalkalibacterium halodurans]
MNTLCIIPCGNKKIWDKQEGAGPVAASEAYIGTLHRLCAMYAERFFDHWVILSAKHGFLFPDDVVDGPYDVSFSHTHSGVITLDQLTEQVHEKMLDSVPHVVLLTGKKYRPIVEACFPQATVECPLLSYSGIGYMQQALKRAIEQKQPLHSAKRN